MNYDVAHVLVERHRQQISTRAYRLVVNIGPLVHYRHEIRPVSVVTVDNALCVELCVFRLPHAVVHHDIVLLGHVDAISEPTT